MNKKTKKVILDRIDLKKFERWSYSYTIKLKKF